MPLSTDLNKYGEIINNEYVVNGEKIPGIHYHYKDNIIIFVHESDKVNERRLTVFKNNAKYIECVDIFNENTDVFIRKINDFTLYIDNSRNKILHSESIINCKHLRKGKIDLIKDNKISTFDIECYTDENRMFVPYACGYVDPNKKVRLYYLTDFKDQYDMFKNCIIDMLNSDLGTVYVHNLSRFDIFFLNNILKEDEDLISDFKLNKDGKILKITVKSKDKKNKGKFVFKDSILLIQGSLRDLTQSFNTTNVKSYFPYKFPNKDNLNYIGDKPAFEYFTDIKQDEYDKIPNNNWNLKEETLKYLKYDLISLQEVIKKFSDDIYELEKLNITKSPTTSSLAFKALTTNYINPNLLYQVKGPAHHYMRSGYFGGITEVYNLIADNGLRIYDINSSYPASMKQAMPIGKPI